MQSSKTKDVLKGVLSVVSSWEEKGAQIERVVMELLLREKRTRNVV
jgi:hypothetical protein